MARRGISEKVVHVFSPFPLGINDEVLFKKAGLDLMSPTSVDPFEVKWVIGGGDPGCRETVRLLPGESILLRESEAKLVMRQWKELGIAQVDDMDDPEQVRAASIEALQRGHKFWKDRGGVRLKEVRKVHGHTREDMEEMKHDFWQYHVNEAKAVVIEAEIKRLRKSPKAA